MKRVLAPVGRILAVLAIYYAAQNALAVLLGLGYIAVNGDIQSIYRFQEVLNEVINFLLDKMPYIVLFAAIIALASYFVIYRDRPHDVRAFLRYRPLDAAAIVMLAVFGIGVNFMVALLLTLLRSLPFLEPLFQNYEELSQLIVGGDFVITLLTVGIIGPVVEEIMFRGLIFGELRKIMPIKIALVVQAVLFGVYHLQPVQGAYAAVIGLLLGLVYYRSSSMVAPMVVHIAINSFSVVSSALLSDLAFGKSAGLIGLAGILFFILSSAYLLVSRDFKYVIDDSLYYLSRRPPRPPEHTAE